MKLLRNIKAFYQRGKRGWADRDCWSLDCHLSEVMANSIEHLKETNHGCPYIHPDSWRKEDDNDTPRGCDSLWVAVQEVIIDGLRAHIQVANTEWPDEFWDGEGYDLKAVMKWEDEKNKQFEAAWILLGKYWRALWD